MAIFHIFWGLEPYHPYIESNFSFSKFSKYLICQSKSFMIISIYYTPLNYKDLMMQWNLCLYSLFSLSTHLGSREIYKTNSCDDFGSFSSRQALSSGKVLLCVAYCSGCGSIYVQGEKIITKTRGSSYSGYWWSTAGKICFFSFLNILFLLVHSSSL